MKTYPSKATKPLLVITLICFVVLMLGVILAFIGIPNIGLPIVMIMMGGLLGVLFLCCYFAEKSRTLIINANTIILPRGVLINEKTVFQKTVITAQDIKSINSSLFKGDGLIAKDTTFYTLRLVDGTRVTLSLYAYGKQAEDEILEIIKVFLA